jgi:ketosteroid isomerase-like protein
MSEESVGQGPHERALREASAYFNENLERFLAGEDVPIHPIWAEDVEIVNFEPSPFPGTYHGHDGLLQWTHDLFDELTDARIDMIEMREDGDLVAARLRLSGRGRASGAEGSFDWGALFEMRDGRLIRASSDPTYEQTLERFGEQRAR